MDQCMAPLSPEYHLGIGLELDVVNTARRRDGAGAGRVCGWAGPRWGPA
jgi:hypothetical protein